jgi:tetratricopeptide (TPR) repeat protein
MALCYVGNMAAFQGETELAEQALAEAIFIGQEIGNKVVLSYALGVLANHVELPRGDVASARLHNEESARHSRDLGLTWALAQTELVQVSIAALQGQWEEGRHSAQAALDIFRELHDPLLLAMTTSELGDLELRAGNYPGAYRCHEQCILSFQEIGQQAFVIHELESFAFIAQRQNRPERTARLLGAAEALREEIGVSLVGILRIEDEYERAVSWLHTQFNESTFREHWADGRAMSMDQAISYSLNS